MSTQEIKKKAQLLKMLSHPTRLLILEELAKGVRCVGEIEELLQVSQANVSQHLALLRYEQVVDYHEEGNLRCYYLKKQEFVQALFNFLAKEYPTVEKSKAELKQEKAARNSCPADVPLGDGKPLLQMSEEEIKLAVAERYSQVAQNPQAKFNFPVGRKFAESVGYPPELLSSLPEGMWQSFTGAGNPQAYVDVRAGECLLDLGCGAGLDLYLYARKVGKSGRLYGLDLSEAMLSKAQANLTALGIENCHFISAPADRIPLEAGSMDIVTSNGIYNLSPNKEAVLREVFRVLKPGGRTIFSEVVLSAPLPEEVRKNINDWFRCIGGAMPEAGFLELMHRVGFVRAEVLHKERNARCGHQLAICANIKAYKP
ncbi:MAG: metalloregulator ArsR/SmtB family transcription factor [Candidatus Schekmanbacteria bacterium]|nr:metalloregulator ArsR/SmtB family transcription factor [Candidatus Schekmanbacteria bacterium]